MKSRIHIFHFVSILYFIFLSFHLNAQITISGTIINQQIQAIEFANIFISALDDEQILIGNISDEKGRFKLEVAQTGTYFITISFMGYDDWKKEVIIDQSINLETIKLISNNQLLDEIVVTADRGIIERKEDKLVFNVDRSPLKNGYDGMEVLQQSPNIFIDNTGAILMRNQAVTILINGRITTLSGDDLANYLSTLRSEEIKGIEIQTHLSANTGAAQSGGVVNIILKKKPVGFDTRLRQEYMIKGDGDYRNYSGVDFNYGAEKWNVYGNYNFLRNSGLQVNYSDIQYYESGDFLQTDMLEEWSRKQHNYRLGFVYDANKNHVFGFEAFATHNRNPSDNNGIVTLSNEGAGLDDGTINFIGKRQNDLYNLTANYTWTIDTMNSQFKLFADYAHQEVEEKNTAISTYNQGVYTDNSERNNSDATTIIYSLQSDLEKYLKNGFKIESGAKLTYTDRENSLLAQLLSDEEWTNTDRTTAFNYREQILAGYLSFSKNIDKDNFVKIGLRVENTQLKRVDRIRIDVIQQNYTDWLPSAFYSRNLSNENSLTFSYSKRLRRPSFRDLNNNVSKVNDFRYILGNPDLQPEYIHNFEGSFKQRKQTTSIYYSKTVDAINGIYFLEDQVAFYKRFNAGSQTQFGMDYNRFGNLNKWWYLKFTTGLYRRKFTNGEGVDSFEQTSWYANFSNNFKINSTTSLDFSGYYVSPVKDAFYKASHYYAFNLMLQKTFFQKKLSARIYVNDIFNTLIYKNERPFETFISTFSVKPQTRRINLWVSYNFSTKNKTNSRKNKSKNDARRRL